MCSHGISNYIDLQLPTRFVSAIVSDRCNARDQSAPTRVAEGGHDSLCSHLRQPCGLGPWALLGGGEGGGGGRITKRVAWTGGTIR